MSVWKYVKVKGAWRYKAAIEDKGKIIPNMVRVDGKVEFHEEGTYYFRSDRRWIKLDAMPTSTQEARERLQAHDLAVKHGLVPVGHVERLEKVFKVLGESPKGSTGVIMLVLNEGGMKKLLSVNLRWVAKLPPPQDPTSQRW